ncbi:MAG: helix-turn-helix domain-containing protein [Turicibacter sp.]
MNQMNKIEERMYQFSVKNISEKTGIAETTIYRWKREENIAGALDFINFLHTLDIDPVEYMKEKKGLE